MTYLLAVMYAFTLAAGIIGMVSGRIRIISKEQVELYDKIMMQEARSKAQKEERRREERDKLIQENASRYLAALKDEETADWQTDFRNRVRQDNINSVQQTIEFSLAKSGVSLSGEEPGELPDAIDDMLKDAGVSRKANMTFPVLRPSLEGFSQDRIDYLIEMGILPKGAKAKRG